MNDDDVIYVLERRVGRWPLRRWRGMTWTDSILAGAVLTREALGKRDLRVRILRRRDR